MENLSGALQEFLLFDCEITQPTASARMKQRFPEKFSVRSMNQRVRSQNLLQQGKRSARSKQQSASRECHSLFLPPGFKSPDGEVSQSPCLGLHPRDEFAGLSVQHFFRRVIRLAEFIRESFDQVNSLSREHNR